MAEMDASVPTIMNGHPVGGCKLSHQPSSLPKFGAIRELSDQELPSEVDYRQLMSPIEQQEQINAWLVPFVVRIMIKILLFFNFSVGNALAGKA